MSNLKDIIEANESFKKNREGLHPDIIGFSEELISYFPNAVFTSGKRPGAVTNFGKPSRHSKGEAVDLRITPEIGEFLSNDKRGVELLYKYQLGFLDESKAENKKWGNALHIGKDTALVERTNNKWNEWKNKREDNTSSYVSNGVINFQKQPSMVGVDLSNAPEEEKSEELKQIEKADKNLELEERKQKLFEQFNQREPQEQEVVQQQTQAPDFNVLQTYQEVDQFVSNPIMQQGGQIPTSPNGVFDYPNQAVNVPTNGSITMQGVDY